jgi:hypothetical protein
VEGLIPVLPCTATTMSCPVTIAGKSRRPRKRRASIVVGTVQASGSSSSLQGRRCEMPQAAKDAKKFRRSGLKPKAEVLIEI